MIIETVTYRCIRHHGFATGMPSLIGISLISRAAILLRSADA